MNLNHPANIMDKDESAVDKFLKDTNENLFDKPADPFEKPLEVKEEIKEEKPEEKEEKPLPFHRDPKVQKYIEKEISKRLDREVKPAETSKEDEFKDVIDSFTTIIGNDKPEKVQALNALKKALIGFDQKAAQRAEEKIEEIAQREAAEDAQAEEELDNAFESIEENYDVRFSGTERAENLRREFASFVEKIAPKDRNGEVIDYPDMNSAWETFSEIKKATTQPSRAKELASRSLARSSEAPVKQEKRVDWNAVDEFMDTLK